MKKILAMMCIAASVFAACTPEDDSANLPSVSFESAVPVAADGTATFKIVTANYTAAEAVTIPVTFSGAAVLDTDYTVSAEAFVIGGEAPVTEITVTALNYGTGKDVTLTLGVPEGWTGGKYTASTFTLADKLGAVSFSSNRAGMTNKVTLTVGVYDTEGNSLRLEKGDKIAVVVNTDESTAVEGTHFSFAGEKEVSIAAGENSGTITLNMIGDAPVEDADTLVLELDPGAKYDRGTNRKVTITILGAEWNRLDGEWKIDTFYNDSTYMFDQWGWGGDLTKFELLPEYDMDDDGVLDVNVNDKIVFDMSSLTFTPYFESTLKNYFVGVSNISPAESYNVCHGSGHGCWDPDRINKGYLETPTMWFDNTNRYFSATEQSDDKVSLVGYGLGKDENDNDLLYIYIIDYTSKSFIPEWLTSENYSWIYLQTKPTACDMSGVHLSARFKRVTE